MKSLFAFSLILILTYSATAEKRDEEKAALQKLVTEREQKFGEYSRAAASKTGFFGNKTKNDLRKQVAVLTEIIKTDNRIISLLKNFLDYRTFQRTEMNYSQAELDERVRHLDEITDGLAAKVDIAEAANIVLQKKLKWSGLTNWLLAIGMAIMTVLYIREKRVVR
ncbi:MAG TPA: hypothetical protein VFW78_11800 [Bacteroidia bacterium]|nr:hypothetical protein [Bacteroidia bacterium]